jgi:hypothetical protein
MRISPNKNRIIQVRRSGGRKLFDGARKGVFLEWLAATCNIQLSAEKAGICYSSVFRHIEKDSEFEAGCERALRLGYFRLEARSVQEAHVPAIAAGAQPATASELHTPHPPTASRVPPSPPRGEGLDIGEEYFDPVLALALLREHKRNVHGRTPKQQRTTARTASAKEIAEALAKRLRSFKMRVAKDEGTGPSAG